MPTSNASTAAFSRAVQLRRSFSTKYGGKFAQEVDLGCPTLHESHGIPTKEVQTHSAMAEEAPLTTLKSSPLTPNDTEAIERDYEAPLREYSKFSASVSQLFDSASLNNIVAAVENEPPLSREEHLQQLRIRAGLIHRNEAGLRDYYTQSYQQQQKKAAQDRLSFTGSLPALNTQSVSKPSGVFGSFMSRAQNAASGLMKQVNVVAEAAKQAVSEAHAMISVEDKQQQQQSQKPQLQRQHSKRTLVGSNRLSQQEANLPELTPPTPDDAKVSSEEDVQGVLIPSEFINEDERKAARRVWGQSSSIEQDDEDYGEDNSISQDQEEFFDEEEDRNQWIKSDTRQRRLGSKREEMMTVGERINDEAWLRSRNKDERAAIRARDGMLMAAVTGIHDPMVNGQDYCEDEEEDYDDHQVEEEDHRTSRRNGRQRRNHGADGDDIRSHVHKGHRRSQVLSEEEERYHSGQTDEEIEETEERSGEFNGYFRHRSRQKSGGRQSSYETNGEESDFVEDEMGSNEDVSSERFQRGFNDFYSSKHRHQRQNHHLREHRNSSSLTSYEGVRLLPPPENERHEGGNDDEQKRENRGDETTGRSTRLQSRLESLKPATTTDIDTKQSIARRRWFDAFDHVCRQLNEKESW
uniref:DUF2052 domain-containing protein n=1 Tax=Echinococcus granulosus TaxID=6210 RepID=A0A068WK75_ECHGR|nr:hypothetical protein EgrG_001081100 [Echinococcus granulosus]